MHRRLILVLVVLMIFPVIALANHSWGNYHWGRTANPFTLKLHDNLTSNWEPYLQEAVNDWNPSTVLNLTVLWGQPLSSARKCASTAGRIEVCNARYGNNGWLGIAGISISGTHITKAYTKLNDSYFDTATYNTPAWRRLVTCQEIAHDFGLDHQDEAFDNANLGSCMDYTNDPDGGAGGASSNDPSNEHPNSHDFQQISTIYQHLDSVNTYSAIFDTMADMALRVPTMDELMNRNEQWGTPIRFDREGRPTIFFMPAPNHGGDHEEPAGEYTCIYWAPHDPFVGEQERDLDPAK